MKYPQTPDNPFGQFLVKRISDLDISRTQIATRMGYKNVSKALRRLDDTIETGIADKELLRKIMAGLDISMVDLNNQIKRMNQYLEKKRQEQDEEARAAFLPYLLALCERNVPSPIFIGCMTAGMRIQNIDKNCLALPHIDLLAFIGSQITEHFRKREGGIPAFGAILGYALHRQYKEERKDLLFFNTDGTLTDDHFPELSVRLGNCSLSVGGRDILPLLRFEDEETDKF